MPKKGLPDHVWYQRLQDFAAGKFTFGRGQAPPKDSYWGRLLARIKSCPASGGTLGDALGQRVVCYCGYHGVIFFLKELRIQLFHKLYFKLTWD